tara:strand:+ start:882 stop:1409 length:528 start_codon:yes stop_codon:yes gene_type:complete
MATEEESDKSKEKPQLNPEVKSEEKPVYKFPHQVLMQRNGKNDSDVDADTKEYINDFNDFLKHVKMTKASAEKKGNKWELPETKKNKLLRLSKSICKSLQLSLNKELYKEQDKINKINEEKELERKKKEFLMKKRIEARRRVQSDIEENKLKQQQLSLEEKKKEEEEEDTYGFWF